MGKTDPFHWDPSPRSVPLAYMAFTLTKCPDKVQPLAGLCILIPPTHHCPGTTQSHNYNHRFLMALSGQSSYIKSNLSLPQWFFLSFLCSWDPHSLATGAQISVILEASSARFGSSMGHMQSSPHTRLKFLEDRDFYLILYSEKGKDPFSCLVIYIPGFSWSYSPRRKINHLLDYAMWSYEYLSTHIKLT